MVHIERYCLRQEIHRNKQEASQSEKILKERKDERFARDLPPVADQREQRLRDDMEHFSQQEQTLGTLDTKIVVTMERLTQAMMG